MSAPIKLTNAQLESLAAGLAALDGITIKGEFTPFVFDDDTTWLIALNTEVVKQALIPVAAARRSLAKQHGVTEGMKLAEATPAQLQAIAAFFEAAEGLSQRGVEVTGLEKIKRDALKTSKNAIPASVRAKLLPILE